MNTNRTLHTARALALIFALSLAASAASAQSAPAMAQARPAMPQSGPARANGQTASTPDEVFAAWDRDHNKTLSIDEFKAGWEDVREATMMRRLQAQFAAMDSNKNGAIDAAEYANLPAVRNSGASAPPLSAFDTNRNLSLDFKEFLGFVESMMKNARPTGKK